MGSCFGKKPSTLKHNLREKTEQSAFRDFTKLSEQHSFIQNKKLIHQQQQNQSANALARSQSNQIRCASNNNNNTASTNSTVTNSGVSTSFIQLHQTNTDSGVSNATNLTNSSVAEEQHKSDPINKFNKNAYIALFDYVARTIEDLSFKKGKFNSKSAN